MPKLPSFKKNILAYALMGIGSGLSGHNYLGDVIKFSAMQELMDWKKEKEGKELDLQKKKVDIAERTLDTSLASKGFIPDPNGDIEIGGQTYRYDPTIANKQLTLSGSLVKGYASAMKQFEPHWWERYGALLQHLWPGTQGYEDKVQTYNLLKDTFKQKVLGLDPIEKQRTRKNMSNTLPEGITEDDVKRAMKKYNLTREQVVNLYLKKIGAK